MLKSYISVAGVLVILCGTATEVETMPFAVCTSTLKHTRTQAKKDIVTVKQMKRKQDRQFAKCECVCLFANGGGKE